MTASPKSLDLGPFVPGMDNRRPAQRMKGHREDKGDFLRFGVNVDISSEGTVKRRAGYARVLAGSDCHSFWANGADAFMVDGQSLMRITGLPALASATTLRSGLAVGRPMSFARAPRSVYYSNGVDIGRVSTLGMLGVSTPELVTPPVVAAAAGGALAAGRYGLCFTYLDAAGEESASTTPVWVEVAAGQSISVTGLPAAFPSGTAKLTVYMTLLNDSVLSRAFTLAAPQASLLIPVLPALGARCPTLQLRPMPAGSIVRLLSGRLLVASGSTLFFSEPYQLGLTSPTRGWIQFPSDITVMEPTSGGLWVCADQTYWFGGLDIAAATLDAKAPYGGVAGSGGQVPNSNDAYWMSPRGIMRGTQDGELANLQEAHVAVEPAGYAAGFFREFDGRKQIGESTFATEPNRMAAASYMDAEVIRKEVTL